MSSHGEQLSERKKQILKAIVEAHIQGGEPVGSKYITESKQLTCSSATIRNEMAELENMGLLEQPHTSAGRVPSKQGYRLYVDTLLEEYAMTAKEIAQINQLMKVKMSELDRILDKASKVASSLTNYTGFAIKPRSHSISVTKFEAAYIDEHSFILIFVASDGSVKTRNVMTDASGNPIISSYAVRFVIDWISVMSRFYNFGYGLFDFAAIFYYLSLCTVFVFLTVRIYDRRRWG